MREFERTQVPFRSGLQARVLIGVLLGLAMMLAAVLLVFYGRGYDLLLAREKALASSATQRLAAEVGQQLALAEGLAATLANLGEVLPRDAGLWRRLLPHLLDLEDRADLIAGGGIWPEPDEFEPGTERRSFFWGRDAAGKLRYFDDYNAPGGPGYHQEEWYVPARHQREAHCYWSRSYQDPYTSEAMVTCTVPMHRGARFIGVSTVDLRLSGLQRFLLERGQALNGYAFALDRNEVFITRPPEPADLAGASYSPTVAVEGLIRQYPVFAELAAYLRRGTEIRPDPELLALARDIAAASDNIDDAEALRIADQLRDDDSSGLAVRQTTLDRDAFLGEPVLVTSLRFPDAHWQLVVVQPARLVRDAVLGFMRQLAWTMSLAIIAVMAVAGWLVRRYLVMPIRRMVSQLAVAEQSSRPGRIDVPGGDELGLLARKFNAYAEQLQTSSDQLRASAAQFRAVTELAHDALIQIDDDGLIRSLNRSGELMFGWREEELLGAPLSRLMPWDPRVDGDNAGQVERRATSRAATRVQEFGAERRDGSNFPAEVSVSYWRGPSGGLYNLQVRDVTERKRSEEQIRMLATHDTLTGLPNRTLFNDRLEQAVEQSLRTGTLMAVLFLDLDHFKLANDSLGHAVGDGVLCAVAERLRTRLVPGASLARLGGDEFALLLPQISDASVAARTANTLITALADPFDIGGHRVQVGVSVGITLCPNDDQNADQLLRKADLAMYHAKAEGRNTYRFYTERLHHELTERRALLDDLANAIACDQFVLHYQPVVSASCGALHGIEALIRWQHPQRGLLAPDLFVPLCESSGLIAAMGQWVIERALADLAAWDAAGLPRVRLALNLSLAQFHDPELVKTVSSALARHSLTADRLEFELTETVLMHDQDEAVALMLRLRSLGVSLSVDDFGTGYSSLAYLKRFPVQKLKIDKSFVIGVADDPDSAIICRSVIGLGHNLGMELVAEGVERKADLAFIQRHGCDWAQGFHYSAALPMPELRQWLASRSPALELSTTSRG
ncbi:MAG: EAL domain-containing protein [Lysobacterales bacterium]